MGETCKLCLKYIQGDSVAALDEDLLAKLDFIQMDLERSVEQSNSICTECKEKIQNAFDFKFCLVQTDSAKLGESGSQAQNKCDIPSTSSGESSTEKTICHLCKNSVTVISVISLEKLLKDDNVMEVFQGHIPELELQECENSMVCESCQKALASFSILVSSWSVANDFNEDDDDEDMKEDMENFGAVEVKKEDGDEFSDSNTNSSSAVNASDGGKIVKKAKGNRGQITKIKTESDEESDSNESVSVSSKDVKKEESGEEDEEADLQLKDEEVDIKDEDGLSNTVCEAFSYVRKTNVPYLAVQLSEGLESHYIQTNNEKTAVHKNQKQIRLFKCNQCTYQAKRKEDLKNHEIVHKGVGEIELFRCNHCSFESNGKQSLKQHEKVHIQWLTCDLCSYKAKYQWRLKQHQLVHRSLDKVEMFRCNHCPFITNWRYSLRQHSIAHKRVDEIKMFSCNQCPFETKWRYSLRQHSIAHKRVDEIKMFSCNQCPFETKWRHSLRIHSQVHKLYKCSECSYEFSSEASLKRHEIVHKDVCGIQLIL